MPSGVYNRSHEIKENMSIKMMGNKNHRGFKHSEESKNRMSEKAKQRTPWNKGKKATEESKQKMSKAKTIVTGNTVYRDWETDRKSTRLNSSH